MDVESRDSLRRKRASEFQGVLFLNAHHLLSFAGGRGSPSWRWQLAHGLKVAAAHRRASLVKGIGVERLHDEVGKVHPRGLIARFGGEAHPARRFRLVLGDAGSGYTAVLADDHL